MKTSQGLTLIEVIIAAAILGMVMASAMMILSTGSEATEKMTLTGDLEHRGRLFAEEFNRDFLDARFTEPTIAVSSATYAFGIFNNGTDIRYRIVTGRDSSGNLEFGYRVNTGATEGLACFIRFEAETVLKETSTSLPANVSQPSSWASPFPALPTLTQEVLNVDMNRDGDLIDTFVRGKVMRYVVAPDGHALLSGSSNPLDRSILSDYVILAVDPTVGSQFNGNVDSDTLVSGNHSDSVNDPLFRFVDEKWPLATSTLVTNSTLAASGKAVLFKVTHGTYDHLKKGFLIRMSQERIAFRNTQ